MDGHLEVSGTGRASAVPDVVRLQVGVRVEADDVSSALAGAGSRAAGLAQAARDHGVAATDLRTTDTGVHPRHALEGDTVVGYTAYQNLSVTVRDADLVGTLVDAFAGVAGNALTIDHIGLDVADPQPLLARAREAAFADARAKAEQYAALAGRELGKVRELWDVVPGGPQPRMAMMASRAADTSVELGEHTVTTTVVVRWDWKQTHG
ncbi:SIMPL domain-containing protein [Pedococcus sp. KACC 23699]|uniref:SIMPL domain-containing protein n=1 Tax=Pedococcus sp. KACC 23699 TaxID=3149228 RepID=A0AAU7JVH8_9MICO